MVVISEPTLNHDLSAAQSFSPGEYSAWQFERTSNDRFPNGSNLFIHFAKSDMVGQVLKSLPDAV